MRRTKRRGNERKVKVRRRVRNVKATGARRSGRGGAKYARRTMRTGGGVMVIAALTIRAGVQLQPRPARRNRRRRGGRGLDTSGGGGTR